MTTFNTSNYYDEIHGEIMTQLDNLYFYELVSFWNEYAMENDPDSVIFENNEESLEMLSTGLKDTIHRIKYGEYAFDDDYFTFNGYGNYESFNHLADSSCPIDLYEMANWLTEDNRYEDYGYIDLTDFLNELMESEEDEDKE